MMKSNHGKKYNMLKKKLNENRDDPYLKACYEGKLAIITKQIEILDSEKQLSDIVNATKIIMNQLNKQLIEISWWRKFSNTVHFQRHRGRM